MTLWAERTDGQQRPDRTMLIRDLRQSAFGFDARRIRRGRRIGAEVELLPRVADTGTICPLEADVEGSILAFLRCYGSRRGWREQSGANGAAPEFRLPEGGTIAFEPGGQLEYSSPPLTTATALIESLDTVVPPLRKAALDDGIELLAVGIDPLHSLEKATLQVRSGRYMRMARYFDRIGPAGAIMMRQSASLQLNLDFGDEPFLRWRVLNAAAPSLIAIFANSPIYAGSPGNHASFRAHIWRTLDAARTGIFDGAGDPVAQYLDFACAAPTVLDGAADGLYPSFGGRIVRRDATFEQWRAHLTTLFPEVCPKGYLEVRSIDAIPPRWHAAPVVLLTGITYHRPSLEAAEDLLGPADPELLDRAGVLGLRDVAIGRAARDLFQIGLRGAAALAPDFVGPRALETARAFYERYTARDRSPADDHVPVAASPPPVPTT